MVRTPPTVWPAAWSIREAITPWTRTRGLLGRSALGDYEGLWLPVRSVHTLGMRLTLDLVWLAGDGSVVRMDRRVQPGRCRSALRAAGGVVEVAAGRGPRLLDALGGEGSEKR